jgi:hypothetical protein
MIAAVGLLERLEEVMSERDWNARQWAIAAKLPAPTHLYTLLRRLKVKPDSTADLATMTALADTAGVTLDWLALGRAPKYALANEPDPLYPSRKYAIAAARILGRPETAIATVARVDDLATDPGADYWLERIALAALETRVDPPALDPPSAKNKL